MQFRFLIFSTMLLLSLMGCSENDSRDTKLDRREQDLDNKERELKIKEDDLLEQEKELIGEEYTRPESQVPTTQPIYIEEKEQNMFVYMVFKISEPTLETIRSKPADVFGVIEVDVVPDVYYVSHQVMTYTTDITEISNYNEYKKNSYVSDVNFKVQRKIFDLNMNFETELRMNVGSSDKIRSLKSNGASLHDTKFRVFSSYAEASTALSNGL